MATLVGTCCSHARYVAVVGDKGFSVGAVANVPVINSVGSVAIVLGS